MSKDINVLAIESSCDETSAAVIRNGREVLSDVIYSQIDLHTLYGGVVPEIASRKHIEKINQVIEKALADAGRALVKARSNRPDGKSYEEKPFGPDDLDAVCVTYGPGLVGALLVGVAEAKAIAFAKNLPLVGVHHIKGHVCANYIEHPDLEPPFLCLVASGGHTHLVNVTGYTAYEVIGRTRDDAVGEAFDKIARAIGLGYPGGPKVEKAAKEGNSSAYHFPRAKISENPYDFSFSGVKSAILNTLNSAKMKGEEIVCADVAASFQAAVIDSLKDRVALAIDEFRPEAFAIAGGVASNQSIRAALKALCGEKGIPFYCPSPVYCTDNAAMIGVSGYYEFMSGKRDGWDLNAVPQLKM